MRIDAHFFHESGIDYLYYIHSYVFYILNNVYFLSKETNTLLRDSR